METSDGESRVPKDPFDYAQLRDHLTDKLKDIEIDQRTLCYKDSSLIGIAEWELMINEVKGRINDYRGFIISHGTDTMTYSAAALAYSFAPSPSCPIVFTGSCRTPDIKDTDAWHNLASAVVVAAGDINCVSIVFAGKILHPCRAMKVDSNTDDIFISSRTSAAIVDDISQSSKYRRKAEKVGQTVPPNSKIPLELGAARFSDKLIFLHSVPSINPRYFLSLAKQSDWRIALVQGFGTGNPSEEILGFIEKAVDNNKHIVIMPAVSGESIYPPLRRALDAGAILARGYVQSALWVKLSLLWGYAEQKNLSYEEEHSLLEQGLAANLCGEIITKR